MAEVTLVGGAIAYVDDTDLQLIAQYKWYLSSHGYAVTTYHRKGASRTDKGRNVNIAMHRLIAGFPDCKVDHRDRNRLNNRRGNLRLASNHQNVWNNGKQIGASGYLGVRQESANCFSARLGAVTIGYYATDVKAAQAHDIEAVKVRGEYARLNFKVSELPSHVEPLSPRNIGERTSSVAGVSFAKNRKAKAKWRAVWRKKHLGWFLSEEDAIKALKEVKGES